MHTLPGALVRAVFVTASTLAAVKLLTVQPG